MTFQNDERRCAQIAVESVITWGEAVGVADLPQETARAIAADVTYRLRQTLHVSFCKNLLFFLCNFIKNFCI